MVLLPMKVGYRADVLCTRSNTTIMSYKNVIYSEMIAKSIKPLAQTWWKAPWGTDFGYLVKYVKILCFAL